MKNGSFSKGFILGVCSGILLSILLAWAIYSIDTRLKQEPKAIVITEDTYLAAGERWMEESIASGGTPRTKEEIERKISSHPESYSYIKKDTKAKLIEDAGLFSDWAIIEYDGREWYINAEQIKEEK